jgi:hypothetical protein
MIVTIQDGPHGRGLGAGRAGLQERVPRQRVHAFLEVIAEHLWLVIKEHALSGPALAAPARILSDPERPAHSRKS